MVPRGGGSITFTPQGDAGGKFPWWISSNLLTTNMLLAGGAFAMSVTSWQIPLWMFIVVGLVIAAPAFWLNRRSRQWRLAGHCPGCGYDLRESPDRCPECGRPALVVQPSRR